MFVLVAKLMKFFTLALINIPGNGVPGTCSTFFEERNGNAFLFSKEERGTERVPEIRGTKLRSVHRSFSFDSHENANL